MAQGATQVPGFLASPSAVRFNTGASAGMGSSIQIPGPGDISMPMAQFAAAPTASGPGSRLLGFVQTHKTKIALGVGALVVGGLGYYMATSGGREDAKSKLELRERAARFEKGRGYLTVRSSNVANEKDYAFVNALAVQSTMGDGRDSNDDVNLWVFLREDGTLDTMRFEPLDQARTSSTRLTVRMASGDTDQTVFVDKRSCNSESGRPMVRMRVGPSLEMAEVSIAFDDSGMPIFVVKGTQGISRTQQIQYMSAHGNRRIARLVDPERVVSLMRDRQMAVEEVLVAAKRQAQTRAQPQSNAGGGEAAPEMVPLGGMSGGSSAPVAFQGDQPHWPLPNVDPPQGGAMSPHPSDIDIDVVPPQ